MGNFRSYLLKGGGEVICNNSSQRVLGGKERYGAIVFSELSYKCQ